MNLTQELHHLDTAWRRRDAPNVVRCHYADYSAGLPAEVEHLTRALDIDITTDHATGSATEAALDHLRGRMGGRSTSSPTPAPSGTTVRLLRVGGLGKRKDRETDEDLAAYGAAVADTASADPAQVAHQGRLASGIEPTTVA